MNPNLPSSKTMVINRKKIRDSSRTQTKVSTRRNIKAKKEMMLFIDQ